MAGRPAIRTPCWYEVLRQDKNRDSARVKNAYGKHTKIQATFAPYLVRNSLHVRSVFLRGIMVFLMCNILRIALRVDDDTSGISRTPIKIQFGMRNSLRIALIAYFGANIHLRITLVVMLCCMRVSIDDC